MGKSCHLGRTLPPKPNVLTSKGIVPMMLPAESRNSPVSRWVKIPERNRNLCVLSQISGWFCWIQLERQYCVTYSTNGYAARP